MPYQPVWQAMQQMTQKRNDSTVDEVWLLQHEPVFTLGQAGKSEHVLMPGDIPLVQTDRGGQVTYHGPGQLVAYVLLQLSRMNIGTRDLVTRLERSLVDLLAEFDIEAGARADAPGVYVGEKKIASLGLRVRKGATYHGMSLNIDMDLEPFKRINPCGYAGLEMIQLKDFVTGIKMQEVSTLWLEHFRKQMGYHLNSVSDGLPVYK